MAEEVEGRRGSSGERLTWVLIGVLALIVVSLFAFEGATQSSAIVAVLVIGLAGIAWSTSSGKKQP